MTNNRTRKRQKGSGFFGFFKSTFSGDSNYCTLNDGKITCSICNDKVFLMRG